MGRMTARFGCLAAAAALGATVVTPLAMPAVAGAASSSFQVHLNEAGASVIEDLSCPAPRECIAVGGGPDNRAVIFRTINGGMTWSRELVPRGTNWLEWVSCSNVDDCVAVGQDVDQEWLASSNGGVTWRVTRTTGIFWMEAVACAGASVCEAAGGAAGFYRSRNDGATWTPAAASSYVSGSIAPHGLACPSVTTCFAIAGSKILKSHDAGRTFSTVASGLLSIAPGGLPLSSISCVSTTRCAVAGIGLSGRGVLWTVDGGSRWESTVVPASLGSVVGVNCSGPGTCTVVAMASRASTTTALVSASTTTRGTAWSVRPLSSFVPYPDPAINVNGRVECPISGRCFVAGFGIPNGSIFSTATKRAPWRRVGVTVGPPPLTFVACPTSLCVAMGDHGLVLRSLDSGTTWSQAPSQLPANVSVSGLACATAASCLAIGAAFDAASRSDVPETFRSSDGGTTWSTSTDPAGVPTGLTCASAKVCMGPFGDAILRTVNGGQTWGSVSPPVGTLGALGDVTCGSATDCIAVAATANQEQQWLGSALFSTNAGATWSPRAAPPGYPYQVTCSSGQTCFVLGLMGKSGPDTYTTGVSKTLDGGLHWTPVSAPKTLGSIVCAASQCAGIATSGPSNGVQVSTLWTGAVSGAGVGFTTATLPSTDVVLNNIAQCPCGRWVVVGGNSLNGPLVLTSP